MTLVLISLTRGNKTVELLIQDHSVDKVISLVEEGKAQTIGTKTFTDILFFRCLDSSSYSQFSNPTYIFQRVGKFEGEWLAWYSQLYQINYSLTDKSLSQLKNIFQDIKEVVLEV